MKEADLPSISPYPFAQRRTGTMRQGQGCLIVPPGQVKRRRREFLAKLGVQGEIERRGHLKLIVMPWDFRLAVVGAAHGVFPAVFHAGPVYGCPTPSVVVAAPSAY
jgi:hypothetical protein